MSCKCHAGEVLKWNRRLVMNNNYGYVYNVRNVTSLLPISCSTNTKTNSNKEGENCTFIYLTIPQPQYKNDPLKKKNRKKITPPLTKKKEKKNNERHPYVAVNECWMMPESLIHSTEGEGVACTGQKSSTSSPATAFTSPTTDSVKRGGTGWRRCKTNNK